MTTYALGNQEYEGHAYMLLCDDTERDYGDTEAAAAFKEKCEARGFFTISERDEFATLYPEGASMETIADEHAHDSVEEGLPNAA